MAHTITKFDFKADLASAAFNARFTEIEVYINNLEEKIEELTRLLNSKKDLKWGSENTAQSANEIKTPLTLYYFSGDPSKTALPHTWADGTVMNVGHSLSYYNQIAFHPSQNIFATRYKRHGEDFSNWRII